MQLTAEKLFDVDHRDGLTHLRLADTALSDVLIIRELRNQLSEMIERDEPQVVIVDFRRVRRISTDVINALLAARQTLAAYDAVLLLAGMKRRIRRVFETLRLDEQIFPIYDTPQAAAEAAAG